MTYLTHDQVSDRIIEILKTFNTFPLNVYNPSLVWSIVTPDKAREFNRAVAKLSWVVADVGILLRRNLLDFSNRNIRPTINWDTISDDWIAGVQFTIGNRRFEWRANISDWRQDER